jgi:hypothetical protein
MYEGLAPALVDKGLIYEGPSNPRRLVAVDDRRG